MYFTAGVVVVVQIAGEGEKERTLTSKSDGREDEKKRKRRKKKLEIDALLLVGSQSLGLEWILDEKGSETRTVTANSLVTEEKSFSLFFSILSLFK